MIPRMAGVHYQRGKEHLHFNPAWKSALEIVVEHEVDAVLFYGEDAGESLLIFYCRDNLCHHASLFVVIFGVIVTLL